MPSSLSLSVLGIVFGERIPPEGPDRLLSAYSKEKNKPNHFPTLFLLRDNAKARFRDGCRRPVFISPKSKNPHSHEGAGLNHFRWKGGGAITRFCGSVSTSGPWTARRILRLDIYLSAAHPPPLNVCCKRTHRNPAWNMILGPPV